MTVHLAWHGPLSTRCQSPVYPRLTLLEPEFLRLELETLSAETVVSELCLCPTGSLVLCMECTGPSPDSWARRGPHVQRHSS